MMNIVRKFVSGKKNRYLEDGFNLDLTYITPRIIAMSLPGEGLSKVYRNSINSVSRFLNEKHRGKFKILNLSGLKYDYEKFNNHVYEYQWEDHFPPTIDLLFKACFDIHQWLLSDPENIIAANCKAGKGRTGTLICCYMIFCGRFQDPLQALKYYKVKRFSRGGGVTQPSQIRYIRYFTTIVTGTIKSPLLCALNRVQIRTAPHISGSSSKLIFEVKANDRLIYSNKTSSRDKQVSFNDNWEDSTIHELVLIQSELLLQGDITCFINHWGILGVKNVCRFSFNTAFIPDSEEVIFEKHELDPDNFKNSKKAADNFFVHLSFSKRCECKGRMEVGARCELCRRYLLPSEMSKWRRIQEILLRSQKESPSLMLFGIGAMDDVEEVLASRVEESDFSSDGSVE